MGRKMSQTAHGQGAAQSGTLLTSGADAARALGRASNRSSVLANCGLGARPHYRLGAAIRKRHRGPQP